MGPPPLGNSASESSRAELEQELRAHLDLAAEDERRRANSSEGATRKAVVRLGAVPQTMEALRDQRGLPWLEDLARDARYGLRTLRRTPMFATVVLVTLAIGIGANTAVFSVVNSVLLKPLAYPSPEELVAVWHTAPGAPGAVERLWRPPPLGLDVLHVCREQPDVP